MGLGALLFLRPMYVAECLFVAGWLGRCCCCGARVSVLLALQSWHYLIFPSLLRCIVCLQHPWLTTDASARQIHSNPAKAAALGAHMVRRLRGFAKLSHMKRLALVLMARSLTDRDVARLRVRPCCWTMEHGYFLMWHRIGWTCVYDIPRGLAAPPQAMVRWLQPDHCLQRQPSRA